MALSTIKNGEEVVAPDGNENTAEFSDGVNKRPNSVWWIEVTVGTVQFAADEAVAAEHRAWPVGSKVPMTVHSTLHYKASAASDAFVVTV